ncbi:calcium:proton antiporter [Actinomyces howellii]|uniref:Calcium/proton antiporter n=1 Tax=Actinomyces howellii TaxID=52771 RepID=A0A448HDU4_9ACTO|nr:calcium:proton antiporter [Actinomyces howellii]VEG26192.1 Calcium/proton antiporter [Actinomyces howellii]
MPARSCLRTVLTTVLTPTAALRVALGWGSFLVVLLARPVLGAGLPALALVTALTTIVAVVIACAFGVVIQAERLAQRLGDPYGTLVLTLSVVVIEVILICAVLLGPGEHTTVARDSVMATTMIVLNLLVGAALVVGGLRHGDLRANPTGVSAYLALLVVLTAVAFVLPGTIGVDGSYSSDQAVPVIVLVVVLYGFFLHRQTGAQSPDFQEVTGVEPGSDAGTVDRETRQGAGTPRHEHLAEVIARAVVLLVTVTPVLLLSHDMAVLLDDGLGRLGAPVALSGVLIATVVLLPEGIATVRAAWRGQAQRVANLAYGALVSCVGLTLPAVLAIGELSGQRVVLAETPTNLVLVGVSLLLTHVTVSARRLTAVHGSAHLAVFVLYGLSVFA